MISFHRLSSSDTVLQEFKDNYHQKNLSTPQAASYSYRH